MIITATREEVKRKGIHRARAGEAMISRDVPLDNALISELYDVAVN